MGGAALEGQEDRAAVRADSDLKAGSPDKQGNPDKAGSLDNQDNQDKAGSPDSQDNQDNGLSPLPKSANA